MSAKLPIEFKEAMMMVACNDDRNGQFAGKCDQFVFYMKGVKLHIDGPTVRFKWFARADRVSMFNVSRHEFCCSEVIQWYGNWCWDMTHISVATFEKLCPMLKEKGFVPVEGPEELWQWWNLI